MTSADLVQTTTKSPAAGHGPGHAAAAEPDTPLVSVVVPGLNEAESLPELAARIDEALRGKARYELIFVDDGSTDEIGRAHV